MSRPTAVLISGRGSNLKALIDAAAGDRSYPARLALVISNRPGAAGLAHAEAAGITTKTLPSSDFADKASYDAALDELLRNAGIELVCLAGFMQLLTAGFVNRWRGRIINIHPSLLPAFKGLKPQQQALASGVTISGCTVHFVTPEMDAGPAILQVAVPVLGGDDVERLSARILAAEHRAYPAALALLAGGAARLAETDDKVIHTGAADTSPGQGWLANPPLSG